MLKFPSDQTISLRIINEKQVSTAVEIHSSPFKLTSRHLYTKSGSYGQLLEIKLIGTSL